MKDQTPLSLGQLAGAGTAVAGTLVVGLVLGYLGARFLGWNWALPAGVVLGFVAGVVGMYRRISNMM